MLKHKIVHRKTPGVATPSVERADPDADKIAAHIAHKKIDIVDDRPHQVNKVASAAHPKDVEDPASLRQEEVDAIAGGQWKPLVRRFDKEFSKQWVEEAANGGRLAREAERYFWVDHQMCWYTRLAWDVSRSPQEVKDALHTCTDSYTMVMLLLLATILPVVFEMDLDLQ